MLKIFIGQSAYSPTSVSSNSIDILSTIYRTFRVAQDAFHAEIRHNDQIENTYLTQIEAFKKVLHHRGAQHELKRLRDYKRGL